MDSSYLLPSFGIEIDINNFRNDFKKIIKSSSSFLINICSFIEIKWIIFHFIRKNPPIKQDFLIKYQNGILYYMKSNDFNLISFLNIEIDVISNKVRDLGITDYFDAQIYSTAKAQEAILITEDNLLHKISNQKPIENEVINWNTFVNSYLNKESIL